MERPNVVFLVLDTLRRDKTSVYSDEVDFTDNLEAFSQEATVFRDAVACSSWTLPSHAAMFTGEHPWNLGTTQRNLSVEYGGDTLVERLEEKGYRSTCITVNGWLSGQFGVTRGFDTVDNLSTGGFSEVLTSARRKMDEWLAREGLESIKRLLVRTGNRLFHYWMAGSETEKVLENGKEFIESGEEPFLLFMNLMDAHEPYFPPLEYREKHGAPDPREVCQDPTDHHTGRKEADFDSIHRIYDASVDYMDDCIGDFFSYLKENGLWEETIVIVTSDHGQMLGEDNEYGHQFSLAEPLVSVPLMVKGMDRQEIEHQVDLQELYDLIPALVDGETPETGTEYVLGGYDFPGMMRPRIPQDRWEEFYRRYRFVRSSRGKATETERENGEKSVEFTEFEDLDSGEREELESRLEDIVFPDEGDSLDEKSEEIQEKLRKLGYG